MVINTQKGRFQIEHIPSIFMSRNGMQDIVVRKEVLPPHSHGALNAEDGRRYDIVLILAAEDGQVLRNYMGAIPTEVTQMLFSAGLGGVDGTA